MELEPIYQDWQAEGLSLSHQADINKPTLPVQRLPRNFTGSGSIMKYCCILQVLKAIGGILLLRRGWYREPPHHQRIYREQSKEAARSTDPPRSLASMLPRNSAFRWACPHFDKKAVRFTHYMIPALQNRLLAVDGDDCTGPDLSAII